MVGRGSETLPPRDQGVERRQHVEAGDDEPSTTVSAHAGPLQEDEMTDEDLLRSDVDDRVAGEAEANVALPQRLTPEQIEEITSLLRAGRRLPPISPASVRSAAGVPAGLPRQGASNRRPRRHNGSSASARSYLR